MKPTGVVAIAYAALLSLGQISCAPALSRTSVRGSATDIQQLVGEWEGVYSSAETGRSGVITFKLHAVADTAQGDVLMTTPRPSDQPNPHAGVDQAEPRIMSSQLLTIRFVAAGENEIHGALDPYSDPVCGCPLITRFYGRIAGNEIVGRFESASNGIFHRPASGTWSVRRVVAPKDRDKNR